MKKQMHIAEEIFIQKFTDLVIAETLGEITFQEFCEKAEEAHREEDAAMGRDVKKCAENRKRVYETLKN